MKFKLGDVVRCRATVFTSYVAPGNAWECELVHAPSGSPKPGHKYLYRFPLDDQVNGMIIGYTHRDTGCYQHASYYAEDSDPPYLEIDKRHRVWMVVVELRWHEPWLVLEDDLTLVARGNEF